MSTVTPYLNLVKPAPLEAFSRATYNTNLDLVDANAVVVDKAAKGVLYDTPVTTSSGAFTALTVINNIATFTFKAGRRYRIEWDASIQSTVDGDYVDLHIDTSATTDAASLTTGLTLKRQKTQRCIGANQLNSFILSAPVTYVSDTTLQIKFCGVRVGGTGSVSVIASANVTALYRIVDEGVQF